MNTHKIKRVAILFAITLLPIVLLSAYLFVTQPLFSEYPLDNFSAIIPSANEIALENHVKFLSEQDRTTKAGQEEIVRYLLENLKVNNIPDDAIEIQPYTANGTQYQNIIVHFTQRIRSHATTPKYLIGAHYDAFGELPGADDNASAVAGLLEIARILNDPAVPTNGKDIDLVFYSTEEPPFYATNKMGSFVHAQSIQDDQNIKLAIILEMIGYFSEDENSQRFPDVFLKYMYPSTGNFVAIVSNFSSFSETRAVKKRFTALLKKNNLIGVESINAPVILPGIDFSDHRNYWKFNIPAIMITDTAFYRNTHYHTEHDTYEKLDYGKMKEVVDAISQTVISL